MAQLSPMAQADSPNNAPKMKAEENDEVAGQLSPGQKPSDLPSAFGLIESAEERRDLVSSHTTNLGPITSIGSVGSTATFSSTPRLTHTPTSADFQPPYFPPPYNLPQQQLDFHHPHVNTDPYINSLAAAQHPQQYHQLHPPQRTHNVIGGRREDDPLHLQTNVHVSLPGSYADSARRSESAYVSVRRPDVLMHSGHHGLSDQDLLNLHGAATLPSLEDGQINSDPSSKKALFSFALLSNPRDCVSSAAGTNVCQCWGGRRTFITQVLIFARTSLRQSRVVEERIVPRTFTTYLTSVETFMNFQ